MSRKKILIVSGEPSGDLHGANLVKDLKSLDHGLSFYGIGGDLSKASGVEIIYDITDLALVGVIEVLKNLSAVKAAHDKLIAKIDADRPDAAILVDYPGFNLRLAKELWKRSIPVIYYISPQVWAWGHQRVHLIKKYVRKMVVFFKFEEKLYKRYGIDAECVGHPLIDTVKATAPRKDVLKKYNLSENRKTIALLPGSRKSEVGIFLPVMADAANIISQKLGGAQFLVSKHPSRDRRLYENAFRGASFDYRLVEGDLHNIVAASDFAVVASGTATLETAILETPHVIIYKANLITYSLYRMVVRTPFLGIVNIIAGKEVVPEFLQFNMTAENIAAHVLGVISDDKKLAVIREKLHTVRSSLGSSGASMRAARSILPLLQ